MRVSRRAIDTSTLAWQQLSGEQYCKLLNGNPEEGAHTLLLRSEPRVQGSLFGQYHPIDEELFCLEGDFTFDGSTWFRDGSYAFYPAYFVHGTNVHVRGGYVVYLRLSGPGQLFTVDKPSSDAPYYVGEGQPADYALQLVDAARTDGTKCIADESPLQVKRLHTDTVTGKGSTLLSAARGSIGQMIEIETHGLLEIFTVSGSFALADGGRLTAHTYHCELGDCPRLVLQCSEPGSLMISHDGELLVQAEGAILSTKGTT
jgi:hypothetical protein